MREWQAHSYEKLSILTDYLQVFATASRRAVNRVYLDAFAGDPQNQIAGSDRSFPGSPETALTVEPHFTSVRLFEMHAGRAAALNRLVAQHPGRDAVVVPGDCNTTIPAALKDLPTQAPTFAFLDPDGMELKWSTIRAIADHKRAYAEQTARSKVEMWILFSTMGIVRMLGSNRAFAEEQNFPSKIAQLYGAWGPWQRVWQARLDGELTPGEARRAYLFLYMDRLADLGYQHLLVRPVLNSRNSELYAMVFVTDHPAGSRLMKWAQERERVRPDPAALFDVPSSRPVYEDLHTGWRETLPFDLPGWVDVNAGESLG